jgi:hypothetical protein
MMVRSMNLTTIPMRPSLTKTRSFQTNLRPACDSIINDNDISIKLVDQRLQGFA